MTSAPCRHRDTCFARSYAEDDGICGECPERLAPRRSCGEWPVADAVPMLAQDEPLADITDLEGTSNWRQQAQIWERRYRELSREVASTKASAVQNNDLAIGYRAGQIDQKENYDSELLTAARTLVDAYHFDGYLTISVCKTISADSIEEALIIARELSAPSLCHQCSNAGGGDTGAWELNGFDDPPDDCVRYVNDIEIENGGVK